MIDLERIKQERTWKILLTESLANAAQLLLMFYGLKMLVTRQGQMPLSVRDSYRSHLHLVSVSGALAAIVGLQYFSFGLFVFLSDGRPPPEGRRWFWRLGRGLLRWGSLALAICCFIVADNPNSGGNSNLPGFSINFDFVKLTGFIASYVAGFIAFLSFLFAMFAREQVKRELDAARCKPLHIWWRPAAYWLSRYWFSWRSPTGFRVVYSDASGSIHKGYCFVYRSFRENQQWGNRRVCWLTDAVMDQQPKPEVWVNDEILRPKLKQWDESTEADNSLENPDEPSN
jgi:hypothetical protein